MSNPFYYFTFIDFMLLTCIVSLGIIWADNITPLRKIVYISLKVGFLGHFKLTDKNMKAFKGTCRVLNIVFIFIALQFLLFILQHMSYLPTVKNVPTIIFNNSKVLMYLNDHNIFTYFENLIKSAM